MKLLICMHVFVGAVLFAIPNMTRREILFAVPVPPDFRQGPAGRHAITMFRLIVAAVVLAGIGVFLLFPTRLIDEVQPAVILGTPISAAIAFYWQYRTLTPYAVEIPRKRAAALTTAPDRLPWFVWLGGCPFSVLGAAALYLYLNWDRIPERFPVQWGIDGPNRWADRTIKDVYGQLAFAGELCVLLLIMGIAGWYGARRSHSRPVILGGIIAIEFVIGCMVAVIAMQPVLGVPVWTIMLGTVAALISIIVVMASKMSHLGEPLDPMPQGCWKGGVIYYNPNDPVVFVEKRGGLGYTFNFGNRWSWILLAGLLVVVASGVYLIG
jgi:uncharacterized membrane protein